MCSAILFYIIRAIYLVLIIWEPESSKSLSFPCDGKMPGRYCLFLLRVALQSWIPHDPIGTCWPLVSKGKENVNFQVIFLLQRKKGKEEGSS